MMCRFVQWPGLSHVEGYHLGAIVATPKVRAVAQCLHNSPSLYTAVVMYLQSCTGCIPSILFLKFYLYRAFLPVLFVREEGSMKHFLPV